MDPGTMGAERQRARERIASAAQKLAERFGAEVPEPAAPIGAGRNPELRALFEQRHIADLLERLLEATEPAGEPEAEPEEPGDPEAEPKRAVRPARRGR